MYTTYIDHGCRHVSRTSILRSTLALKRGYLSLKKIVRNKLHTAMSKLSFRARALDANKSLPVYHAEDVPDLPDIASVNRVVPQMPTGMEKEEETEHHLQRAISAQQIYGEAQRLIIPTPDAILFEADYKLVNKRQVHMPKQLIHVQAFTLEDELPDYDCDDEDIEWLESYNKNNSKDNLATLEFERIIDTLEKGCGTRLDLFTLNDAHALLKKEGNLVDSCFKYWKEKRNAAAILAPPLRTEKKDGSTLHDPYVAFRRRVEKMQTRKNRKNDEASYEKMLALRRDLNRACLILEMVKLREAQKKELLETTIKVLETRYSNKDFQGELLLQCYDLLKQRQHHHEPSIPSSNNNTKSPSKFGSTSERSREMAEERLKRTDLVDSPRKRHGMKLPKPRTSSTEFVEVEIDPKENLPTSTTDETPTTTVTVESNSPSVPTTHARVIIDPDPVVCDGPDGKYTFRRKKGVTYHAPRYDSMGNWPWTHPVEGGSADPRYCYCCTSIQKRCHCIGFARRRMGRGGRVMFDRAYTPYDDFLNKPSTKLETKELTTINGINTPFQDRVPPWPHFKPCVDSSDDDETFMSCHAGVKTNPSYLRDAASPDGKRCFSKPLVHRSHSSQSPSKFRIHPYPSRNNQTHSSINNQVFLASLAASLSKSTDSPHWVSKSKTNCYPINGTNIFTSPIKFQSAAHVTLSPSRPASIAPASAIYQLNFPIVVSSKSNTSMPVNNISHRKNTSDQRRHATTSSASADGIRTQIHGVVTQPIVSRQPINIVKQSYVTHKLLSQQQSGVQINSLQVQPVNAVRANKLSISKGLTISHTPVVSNGMTTAASIQLAR